jgi:hypothetical protein
MLCAKQAQRGGISTGLPILHPSARRGRVVSTTPQALYSQERDPIPIVKVVGWALGLAWILHGGLNPGPSNTQYGAIQNMLSQRPKYCQHSSNL